jgi:hypothetical protein
MKIRILGTKPFKHPFPIFSWLIRLIEWSAQSHVVIHDTVSNYVTHARFNDIIVQPYDEFMKDNVITKAYEIEIDEKQRSWLGIHAHNLEGKQHGYFRTLVGMAIPQALRTISKDKIMLNNWWPRGLSCSWYVYNLMKVMGIKEYTDILEHLPITPSTYCTDDILDTAKKFVDLNKKQC